MQKQQALVLHGAGYVGVELSALIRRHPNLELACVTSRSQAGKPIWEADRRFRGTSNLTFSDPQSVDPADYDAVFNCSEHGAGVAAVAPLLDSGFAGKIVDLSADFRLANAALYEPHYGWRHPRPQMLEQFHYGIPEIGGPYADQGHVANPGCFATGLALAVYPVARHWSSMRAQVTALTGASGSGARAKPTTHFPRRDNSVSAYRVLDHQHLPEVLQCLPDEATITFVPASGPWVRGIWGTAQFRLPEAMAEVDAGGWYEKTYGDRLMVRLSAGQLPVLREVVDTPFCDIGWVQDGRDLVVGFALDNLMKGAASQAIQNMNILQGWPEETGLL